MTIEDRFWSKVSLKSETECWMWNACKTHQGYGRFMLNGKVRKAHRVSYEMVVGKISEGLCIDHLCRNPSCVNPSHLEPVTGAENTRRGISGSVEWRARRDLTHCQRGHEFAPENTIINKYGRRGCKACRQNHMIRYRSEGRYIGKYRKGAVL